MACNILIRERKVGFFHSFFLVRRNKECCTVKCLVLIDKVDMMKACLF